MLLLEAQIEQLLYSYFDDGLSVVMRITDKQLSRAGRQRGSRRDFFSLARPRDVSCRLKI